MTIMAHSDVLIIGAGISGISSAFHLQKHAPQASFEILERGDSIGTWNLFKYPGIRSIATCIRWVFLSPLARCQGDCRCTVDYELSA